MSNRAITWAYRQELPCGAKFVLVALADMADEAHSCYPGQALLASMTGQAERTVRRHLESLESAGLITRAARRTGAGVRTSDRYVLVVEDDGPPPGPAPSDPPPGRNDAGHDKRPEWPVVDSGVANMAKHPSSPAQTASTAPHRPDWPVESPAKYDRVTGQIGQGSLRDPLDRTTGVTYVTPDRATPSSPPPSKIDQHETPAVPPKAPAVPSATTGGRPARFCVRHPEGAAAPCGPCADARRRFAAWEAAWVDAERAARAEQVAHARGRAELPDCPHGVPGGDVPRPGMGTPACAVCRSAPAGPAMAVLSELPPHAAMRDGVRGSWERLRAVLADRSTRRATERREDIAVPPARSTERPSDAAQTTLEAAIDHDVEESPSASFDARSGGLASWQGPRPAVRASSTPRPVPRPPGAEVFDAARHVRMVA